MRAGLHLKPGIIRCCLLFALAAGCFLLTVVRWVITGRAAYFFLNWNLFLAAVPWFISLILSSRFVIKKSKILSVVLFIAWFLFFPNAPYLITDLYYLRNHSGRMFWYDIIMLFMFAWTGLLFGFFSLDLIEDMLARRLSRVKSAVITGGMLFVCAFGIYMGRYLRWNSWDVLFNLEELFQDVFNRFIRPFSYVRTWGFTFLVGLFLNIFRWSIKLIVYEGYISRPKDKYLTDLKNP